MRARVHVRVYIHIYIYVYIYTYLYERSPLSHSVPHDLGNGHGQWVNIQVVISRSQMICT